MHAKANLGDAPVPSPARIGLAACVFGAGFVASLDGCTPSQRLHTLGAGTVQPSECSVPINGDNVERATRHQGAREALRSLGEPPLCGENAVAPVVRCLYWGGGGALALRTWSDGERTMLVATARTKGRVYRVAQELTSSELGELVARATASAAPRAEDYEDIRIVWCNDGSHALEEASLPGKGYSTRLDAECGGGLATCNYAEALLSKGRRSDLVRLVTFGADLGPYMAE